MTQIITDIIGFAAAIITNISFYPQAYEIYNIAKAKEYERLDAVSLTTFSLTGGGCTLWLIYSCILQIYPIMLGSTLTIIPSIYICVILIYWKCYLRRRISSNNYSVSPGHRNNIEITSDT